MTGLGKNSTLSGNCRSTATLASRSYAWGWCRRRPRTQPAQRAGCYLPGLLVRPSLLQGACVFPTFLTSLLHRDLGTHYQCLFLHMALLNYFPILTRNQLVESRRVSFKIPQLLRNAARGPIGRHSAFGTDLHGCKRRATRDRSTTRAPTSESFNCSSTTQNFRDFHFTPM